MSRMINGNLVPTEKLNNRHRLIAHMVAMGHRNIDIAKELGYSEHRVSAIKLSPLFRELVKKLQNDLIERDVGTFLDRIKNEANPTLDVIIALRDGGDTDQVRLGAAKEILDRAAPKKQAIEIDHTKRIIFESAELRQMVGALAEDRGLSQEVIEVAANAYDEDKAGRIRPQTIDEFCTED